MRLVDADALHTLLIKTKSIGELSAKKAIRYVEDAPTLDAVPVRHGKWLKAYGDHEAFGVRPFYRYCSKCNEATVFPYNYCPNCGARMDEDETD